MISVVGYNYCVDYKRVLVSVRVLSKHFSKVHYIYKKCEGKESVEERLKKELTNVVFVPITKTGRGPISRWRFDTAILDSLLEINDDIWYFHITPFLRPLLPFKVGKEKRKRVVLDSHELMPWQVFTPFVKWNKFLAMLRTTAWWPIYIKQMELVDHVIFVSHAVRLYVSSVYPEVFNKSSVISNMAYLGNLTDKDFSIKKKKKIVYVGADFRRTPLSWLVKLHDFLGYEFEYVSRHNNEEFDKYDWVKRRDFMPYEDMMRWLSRARWSIIAYDLPFYALKNYIYTVPNKLFDSLGAFTPVITREHFYELSHLVRRYGVGVVISADGKDLVEKVKNADEYYDEVIENIKRSRKMWVWNEYWEKKLLEAVIGK